MIAESQTKTLPELCNDILIMSASLQQTPTLSDSETLRRRITRYFSELERQAREFNIDSDDVRDAKFALTAFIDEIVISSGSQTWQANPLAVEYFNSWVAGDEFFNKIEDLRKRAHTKADVLEIYYICLTLGFKGRYALASPEKLKVLMDDIYHDLRHSQERATDNLSPHWQRSDDFSQKVSIIPTWAIILSGVALAILILLVMNSRLGSEVDKVLGKLTELIKSK